MVAGPLTHRQVGATNEPFSGSPVRAQRHRGGDPANGTTRPLLPHYAGSSGAQFGAQWGTVKKMYGTPMFRRHCRQIAEQVCDQIQTYRDNDHRVLGVVFRDGSPTCGLRTAAVEAHEDQQWGGMVWNACPLQQFAATEGVYVEEFKAVLHARGLDDVPLLTMPEVPEAGSLTDALEEIRVAFT